MNHSSFYKAINRFYFQDDTGSIFEWSIKRIFKFFDITDDNDPHKYEALLNMGPLIKSKHCMNEKNGISKEEVNEFIGFINTNPLFKNRLVIVKYNTNRVKFIPGLTKFIEVKDEDFHKDRDTTKYFYLSNDITDDHVLNNLYVNTNGLYDSDCGDTELEEENNIKVTIDRTIKPIDTSINHPTEKEIIIDSSIDNNTLTISNELVKNNETVPPNRIFDLSRINIREITRNLFIEYNKHMLNTSFSVEKEGSFFENMSQVYLSINGKDVNYHEVKSKILDIRETISYKPHNNYYDIKISKNNLMTLSKQQFKFKLKTLDDKQYEIADLLELLRFAFIIPEDINNIVDTNEYASSAAEVKILYDMIYNKVQIFNNILDKYVNECIGLVNNKRYDIAKFRDQMEMSPDDFEKLQQVIGYCRQKGDLTKNINNFITNYNTKYEVKRDNNGKIKTGHSKQPVIYIKDNTKY